MKEMNRVLKPGGKLILSVPARKNPRIEFNEQRVYSPKIIDEMLDISGFDVRSRIYITPLGWWRDSAGDCCECASADPEALLTMPNDYPSAGAYFTVSEKRLTWSDI